MGILNTALMALTIVDFDMAYYLLGAAVGLLVLMRMFSSQVYDILICNMTAKWYAAVLDRLSNKQRILDVGIGTATALLRNKSIVELKALTVVGVDIDA